MTTDEIIAQTYAIVAIACGCSECGPQRHTVGPGDRVTFRFDFGGALGTAKLDDAHDALIGYTEALRAAGLLVTPALGPRYDAGWYIEIVVEGPKPTGVP